MTAATTPQVPSLWAPLRVKAFRAMWFAQLGSMLGTWMQTVGAQWVLVQTPDSTALVALVQVAATVPMLLLALPAGALADIMDRRRLLIGVQLFQLVVGSALSALTALDLMPPALLLTFTFLLGSCLALTLPAYQASVQDLVPREQVRMVATLGGVAVNGARAVGPALAGLLLAQVGASVVFAVTAVAALVFVMVLVSTRQSTAAATLPPERFASALRAGGRYVRNSPVVRRMLLRVFLFVLPGAVIWALLPVVADQLLQSGSTGFGLLLGSLGFGAVLGAAVLPRVAARLSANQVLVLSAVLFAGSLVACVTVPSLPVLVVLLVPAGAAWLFVLMGITGALQVFLPGWVRARGLSTFNVVFAGSQAAGSLVWGLTAQWTGLVPTFIAAAVVMLAGAATVRIRPLPDVGHWNRAAVEYWPEPALTYEPDPREGPVLVTVRYVVAPEREAEFRAAMESVRLSRLRTGATSCALYRDGADPSVFLLVQLYPTWEEHLRQHTDRLTATDQEREERANALAVEEPTGTHYFPADPHHHPDR
ncbi:MFS transporter [Pseudonocardia humida]|uniref:MFS transporter n=1 Tax=Pseudonocardia humida TaxID=2800819 RepID=A0ABT1AA14_9PSEU|nr:MFS transporter [Pseudonocardia humida]MCO1659874.1 MFS transporter [Pseudonocardia humida]